MSAVDDLVIDALNNGGIGCICRNATKDKAVTYLNRVGKVLFYLHKDCPVHGIGRYIRPQQQQQREA